MTNLQKFIDDGMTEKYARLWQGIIDKEKRSEMYDPDWLELVHSQGFSGHSAGTWNIAGGGHKDLFLSDYDWHKLWPMNDWERIWVNDKLTLRYILCDEAFSHIFPRYYYYADRNKGLVRLMDHPSFDKTVKPNFSEFIFLLQEKGELACKPNNGTESAGFFKIAYECGNYFINHEKASEKEIARFVDSHPNYLYSEYLKPGFPFTKYDSKIPTIRLVTINENGAAPEIIGGFIRMPSVSTGEANYTTAFDKEDYLIYTAVNFETGWFGNGKKVFFNRTENITEHPITLQPLEGVLPTVKNLTDLAMGIAAKLNLLEILGFDFGLTDEGYKLMEINTHPGVGGMQLFGPLLAKPNVKKYFLSKLSAIHSLSHEERQKRSRLER